MTIVIAILGFLLLNVLLAYVPIILIVGYSLRPKEPKDKLLEQYLSDEISTAEFVRQHERSFQGKKHAPLN